MKHLALLLLALALGAAIGCGSSPAKPKPAEEPPRIRLPGPSPAICDPTGCPIYCVRAACGDPQEACVARCEAVCGDGYFDDRDGPVMACVLGAKDDACTAMKACCDRDYTSQLCADEVDGGDRIEDKPTPEHL